MDPTTFDNTDGEGIVAFQPWRTRGPEYDADHSRWYAHLTVVGERVFEYGQPCGSCGILFRKVGWTEHRVTDAEAVRALGDLAALPQADSLTRLARVLEKGTYHAAIVEGSVRLVQPGAADDYFAQDVVRLFGLEPPDYKEPGSPGTPYYRFGSNYDLARTGRTTGPHKALVASVVMPLHAPDQLSRERIDHWKRHQAAGGQLTAFAVSVVDNQQPAMAVADATYDYEEHFFLTHCLLDGHHRMQAAAELGVPIRILTLCSRASTPS